MKEDQIKKMVREGYASVARQAGRDCGCGCGSSPASACCGGGTPAQSMTISKQIGYTEDDLKQVPEGANLGLGCGNPIALASLKEGEVVLDLGSGGGFDCFLAAAKVGPKGKIIGVDMTPEMLDRARENARKSDYRNVEFRLGEIENLPVADNSVDVIISNCVINLSTDKKQVFREAFRVLKPGGRLMVSDMVIQKELPDKVRESVAAYIGCISGAIKKTDYVKAIEAAGFNRVKVVEESTLPLELMANDPSAMAILDRLNISMEEARQLASSVSSIRVQGSKPV